MKIVVDAFGSDRGEAVMTEGSVLAVNEDKSVSVIIVGDADVINAELAKYSYDKDRIEVVDAKGKITNNDVPTLAIRQKKDSSLVKALEITKDDPEVGGMVSAGSTGAVLTGAFLKIGRIKGVLRPALCPLLPTLIEDQKVALVDCGANMDCRPEHLEQFALMGASYMKTMGKENPRVALVSVGDEDKKGNELTHEVFARLKKQPINFVGNMESRYALTGKYDVLVTDGFVGNVLLKSIEGTAGMVMKMMKNSITESFWAKIGALFMKKQLKKLKNRMDYQQSGGAVFLGVKKVMVKGHGSSTATSIKNSIFQAKLLAEKNLVKNIEENLEAFGLVVNE
ncbi:MAG: phosphate acyltransferase PlsX [Clostridiales bacterium]|nr:phosphate acyltransferase PlsX [Clostridiales bacterium]